MKSYTRHSDRHFSSNGQSGFRQQLPSFLHSRFSFRVKLSPKITENKATVHVKPILRFYPRKEQIPNRMFYVNPGNNCNNLLNRLRFVLEYFWETLQVGFID